MESQSKETNQKTLASGFAQANLLHALEQRLGRLPSESLATRAHTLGVEEQYSALLQEIVSYKKIADDLVNRVISLLKLDEDADLGDNPPGPRVL